MRVVLCTIKYGTLHTILTQRKSEKEMKFMACEKNHCWVCLVVVVEVKDYLVQAFAEEDVISF